MKERKTSKFMLRMSEEELNELEIASYMNDMTKSEYSRRAIRFYYNLLKHAPEAIEAFEKKRGRNE